MSSETPIYTRRPNGLALWLTPNVADAINAQRGDDLTEEQMNNPEVRAYIRAHTQERAK